MKYVFELSESLLHKKILSEKNDYYLVLTSVGTVLQNQKNLF